MSTTTTRMATPAGVDTRVLLRVFEEGYGPGAWHGPDLNAALGDVTPELAFWRPAPGRHNIAEIALHHAYCTRSVRAQLTGTQPAAFLLDGEDWFDLPGTSRLGWPEVRAALESEEGAVASVLGGIAAGNTRSPLSDHERFDLVLGLTCHAVYHAGQVQLLKRLAAEQA